MEESKYVKLNNDSPVIRAALVSKSNEEFVLAEYADKKNESFLDIIKEALKTKRLPLGNEI